MKYISLFTVVALAMLIFAVSTPAPAAEAASKGLTEDGVRITLTIGNKVVPAILFNTPPAKDLMAKLPVTVSLNWGPVDYCGDIDPIKHGQDDVQAGYRSGDLAYWIPGRDFVIFTEDKETTSGAPDLVILGQIKSDIEEIRELGGTIGVTIALDR